MPFSYSSDIRGFAFRDIRIDSRVLTAWSFSKSLVSNAVRKMQGFFVSGKSNQIGDSGKSSSLRIKRRKSRFPHCSSQPSRLIRSFDCDYSFTALSILANFIWFASKTFLFPSGKERGALWGRVTSWEDLKNFSRFIAKKLACREGAGWNSLLFCRKNRNKWFPKQNVPAMRSDLWCEACFTRIRYSSEFKGRKVDDHRLYIVET